MHIGRRTACPESAGNPSMSAIAQLRTATWTSHQRLEKRIDFKARLETLGTYRLHIQGMWGFHAAIEPRLASGRFRDHLADHEVRRKLPLLQRDLEVLGAAPTSVALLPHCQVHPGLRGSCSRLRLRLCARRRNAGWPDAAAAGRKETRPDRSVRRGLPCQLWRGRRGEVAGLGEALNSYCSTDQDLARAATAAAATFTALEAWLCGDCA